jgi:outer membrane lipoprotein SlyB
MDTPQTSPASPRQHPLLLIAALAVILFSLIGTAAIMGWLPSSHGGTRNGLTDADRAALSASLQPGQPGYVAPAQPVQPVVPAQPAYNAQAYAPAPTSSAYGDSGAQGATAAGAAQPAAPATAYVPEERSRPAPKSSRADSGWCATCGNVESVRAITQRAQGSGVGAAGGAILGGLLGNQVGSGHGRQLATVAGAVGGAVLGNQVEGNMKASTTYEIRVRLDDGTLRTFHQHGAPQWRTGDRVRIVKGALRAA